MVSRTGLPQGAGKPNASLSTTSTQSPDPGGVKSLGVLVGRATPAETETPLEGSYHQADIALPESPLPFTVTVRIEGR